MWSPDASRSPLSTGGGYGSGAMPYARRGERLGWPPRQSQRQFQAWDLDPRARRDTPGGASPDSGDQGPIARDRACPKEVGEVGPDNASNPGGVWKNARGGRPHDALGQQSMTEKEPPAEGELAGSMDADDPYDLKGVLKRLGGSQSDHWNKVLIDQTVQTLWPKHSDQERQNRAALAGLIGIGPQDELEGMIAAQLVATHNATMECFRRAMMPEQTFEGRRENLNQANKLSRTYATLIEALNRHRGKGQQKVTVEHVHVHAGGQAVVGIVEPRAWGHVPGRPKG
jgi:hypothetical protein